MSVHSRQQYGPGGGTAGAGIKIGEPDPMLCESIKVRGPDLAAEHPHVGKTHIIAKDNDDIGTFFRLWPLGFFCLCLAFSAEKQCSGQYIGKKVFHSWEVYV
jgi:hypothetical protein